MPDACSGLERDILRRGTEMSTAIHVDLAGIRVADELADYLCSHGLAARVVDDGDDECALEVTDAVTPEERLRQTFEDALHSWLATACLPLIPVAHSGSSYILRSPGD
jgi:hypothetical protein